MMKLSPEVLAAFRSAAEQKNDRDLAVRFRSVNDPEVAHPDDDTLQSAIKSPRETAVEFGISDQHLRVRFIMLDVFRLPGFWRDPVIERLLRARTGTPDSRFGDVCAMIKRGALRDGKPNHVWW